MSVQNDATPRIGCKNCFAIVLKNVLKTSPTNRAGNILVNQRLVIRSEGLQVGQRVAFGVQIKFTVKERRKHLQSICDCKASK